MSTSLDLLNAVIDNLETSVGLAEGMGNRQEREMIRFGVLYQDIYGLGGAVYWAQVPEYIEFSIFELNKAPKKLADYIRSTWK